VANIFEPEWVERDQPPLIGRAARVGAQAGAERLGATLYEIDPGGYGSPFHLHHGNEEMIVVLRGRPTLRTLDGTRELEPGEIVACPVGRRGAHLPARGAGRPARRRAAVAGRLRRLSLGYPSRASSRGASAAKPPHFERHRQDA
jgi:hypothetical protein